MLLIDGRRRTSVVESALWGLGWFLSTLLLHPLSGLSAEPPPCSKPSVLSHVKRAYEGMLMLENSSRKFRIDDPRETGYGAAAAGVNLYTPSKDYYNKSRYCEALIRMNNGETEQAYYRMDGLKDESESDYNFSPCFVRHNTRKDECVDERQPKK